jgi:hypothetical protein
MLLLISTIRKGASEFGVDINGSKLGWILACNEVGNRYSGAVKYGEFYDKLGSYACEKGIHSTELVDY